MGLTISPDALSRAAGSVPGGNGPKSIGNEAARPRSVGLDGVQSSRNSTLPLTRDLAWFEEAIGGLVQGGVYLLGGEPGSGKTTLALQVVINLGCQGMRSLYVTTEQSKADLAMRARQITKAWTEADRQDAIQNVVPIDAIRSVDQLPDLITATVINRRGEYADVQVVCVDSVQGSGISGAATRTYERLYKCTALCKAAGVTVVLIGHSTKTGALAGPRSLEHNVDVVAFLRRALAYRPLFVPKNRYSGACLQPIALQINPETTALEPSPYCDSQCAVARSYLGRNGGIVELQAAVELPEWGSSARILAPGMPRRELESLMRCVGSVPGLDISGLNHLLHCRLPDGRAYHPSMGLATAMAVIGAHVRRDIPPRNIYLGEVDLRRTVRAVPSKVLRDLADGRSLGVVPSQLRVVCSDDVDEASCPGVEMVRCETLVDAVRTTWDDIR